MAAVKSISYLNNERHDDLLKHERSVIFACSIRDKKCRMNCIHI